MVLFERFKEIKKGEELETLGLARVGTVQSRHLGKDVLQALKLSAYSEMMNEARALATKRMAYASSATMKNVAEVIAYGTAVKFK